MTTIIKRPGNVGIFSKVRPLLNTHCAVFCAGCCFKQLLVNSQTTVIQIAESSPINDSSFINKYIYCIL